MYLDHRITIKIARILDMVDMSALLLDQGGNVILPEGDQRVFSIPEDLKQNPTMPFVYGAMTLIGTGEEQPVYVCLHGDSEDIKKCAVLCAELINLLLREDMSQTNREQAIRMMLRGEVEGSEFEALAAEHEIALQKSRCVLYFYFQDMEVEPAISLMNGTLEEGEDLITEVGHHSVAMLKSVGEEGGMEEVEEFAKAFESSFLTETGGTVFIGISDPRESLTDIPDAFEEARNAINVGRVYHPAKHVFIYRNLLLERFLSDVSPEMGMRYNPHHRDLLRQQPEPVRDRPQALHPPQHPGVPAGEGAARHRPGSAQLRRRGDLQDDAAAGQGRQRPPLPAVISPPGSPYPANRARNAETLSRSLIVEGCEEMERVVLRKDVWMN